MELIEDLDPEEARAIVYPALNLMMEADRLSHPRLRAGRSRAFASARATAFA